MFSKCYIFLINTSIFNVKILEVIKGVKVIRLTRSKRQDMTDYLTEHVYRITIIVVFAKHCLK